MARTAIDIIDETTALDNDQLLTVAEHIYNREPEFVVGQYIFIYKFRSREIIAGAINLTAKDIGKFSTNFILSVVPELNREIVDTLKEARMPTTRRIRLVKQ